MGGFVLVTENVFRPRHKNWIYTSLCSLVHPVRCFFFFFFGKPGAHRSLRFGAHRLVVRLRAFPCNNKTWRVASNVSKKHVVFAKHVTRKSGSLYTWPLDRHSIHYSIRLPFRIHCHFKNDEISNTFQEHLQNT